jgi:phasin family protein
MFTPDFTKMFDPNQYTNQYSQFTQNMQKFWDMSSTASASKQNLECMKQVGSIVTDTIATCTEKQFKFAQSTMEDCVETMRDLSSTKGVEDYMSKQAEITKRCAEKAQTVAQDIASQWQKTQAQCTDIISQQLSQSMEWSKAMSTGATNATNNFTKTSSK